MGSALGRVLAYIYLEFLESGPFRYIIPNTARYFRYIDDILHIYPQNLDLHSITKRLNNVEPSIKFTYELESNITLPFLDILLVRNINELEFKVYPPVKMTTYIFIHTTTTPKEVSSQVFILMLYIFVPQHIYVYIYIYNDK